MQPRLGSRQFAWLTTQIAVRLYRYDSDKAQAVRDAWAAVGIDLAGRQGRPGRGLTTLATGRVDRPRAVVSSSRSSWLPDGRSVSWTTSSRGGNNRDQRGERLPREDVADATAKKVRTSRAQTPVPDAHLCRALSDRPPRSIPVPSASTKQMQ
jgi:hypothetical protein